MKTNKKTKQLLLYLIKNKRGVSVTALMKLAYLVDLINAKKTKKQISNFKYIRYNFGPFDKGIYSYIEELTAESLIEAKNNYSQGDEEFITYSINPQKEKSISFDQLTNNELDVIDELLNSVNGYGAKTLTEIAYQTKPMRALRAETTNKRGMGKELNLGTT